MGTPFDYTPASIPYTGAEAWYCAQGGLDVRATSGAMFSSPPPQGNIAPNSGAFTTLLASTYLKTGGAITPWFNIVADYGADTTGAVDSTSVIQSAFTAAAAVGGTVFIPPGTFKLTAAITATIPAGMHLSVRGSGQDASILKWTANGGITLTYGNVNSSSASFSDLSFVTSVANTGSAVALAATGNVATNAIAAMNTFNNVMFRGDDAYNGTNAHYWLKGISIANVTNTNVVNCCFYGSGYTAGAGIAFGGDAGNTTYAYILNITNSYFFQCLYGVYLGAYWQGLQITNSQLSCGYGVYQVGSASGANDQISISNCNLACTVVGVYLLSAVTSVLISSNYFILAAGSYAINLAAATTLTMVGNYIFGLSGTTVAVEISAIPKGVISNNFINNVTNAFVLTNLACALLISDNKLVGNTYDFSIGASSTGIVIEDRNPRTIATLPTAIAGIAGSRAIVNNGASPTYGGAVSTTGAVYSPVFCPGAGGWVYR